MSDFGLSPRLIPGIILLSSISEDSFAAICLVNALHSQMPDSDQLAVAIVERAPELSKSLAVNILDTVSAFKTVSLGYDNTEEFFEWLKAAILNDDQLLLHESCNRSLVIGRLSSLLRGDGAIGLIAKARDVLTDNQRVFLESRVLTDFRPVFESKTVDAPLTGVILHNLKLVFFEGGVSKEFFVTLDGKDLESLGLIIERAKKKSAELRLAWEKTGITIAETYTGA